MLNIALPGKGTKTTAYLNDFDRNLLKFDLYITLPPPHLRTLRGKKQFDANTCNAWKLLNHLKNPFSEYIENLANQHSQSSALPCLPSPRTPNPQGMWVSPRPPVPRPCASSPQSG